MASYMAEMDADPAKLRELALRPDTFEHSGRSTPTRCATIVERLYEKSGWPHVTQEGARVYENTYSPDRNDIVVQAKRNAVDSPPARKPPLIPGQKAEACRAKGSSPDSRHHLLDSAFDVSLA